MNYYIEGDAAKADKIKAAFESKEIRVPHYRSCGDNSLIYFSLNKEVLAVTIKALELFEDNPDYKKLELPVQPKFKVGDRIRWINHDVETQTITDIRDGSYITVDKYGIRCALKFAKQDEWELVPQTPHYDIANFKPKQWVLTRDTSEWDWELTMFAYLNSDGGSKFTCINGVTFKQCIPLNDDTKRLLGTTDMPSEEYINW